MKLFLLKILLQRRARDEGFTLPMVIALGLVMILLGAVNITSANEENLNAITQNSISDSQAIAEIGIARYRELLDRNRVLAINDASNWSSLSANAEFCDGDIANFFPGTSNDVTLSEDGQDLNNNGNSNETFTLGNYSLVSYEYNNADGSFNLTDDASNVNRAGESATGRLTVRGTATDASGNAFGSTQIQVDIPIRINQDDMNNLAPALWIGDDTITAAELGNNLTVSNGNIVLQDKPVTTSSPPSNGCGNFSTLRTATSLPIISDARNIPSIQMAQVEANRAASVAANQNNGTAVVDLSNLGAGQTIIGSIDHNAYNPEIDPATFDPDNDSGDCQDPRLCRYYYDQNSLSITGGDLLTDGIAKATILVDSIAIDASGDDVNIGSNSNFSSSDALEIYVKENNNIIINTGGGNTVNIDAFIHAPNSTLTINGTGTVNINGSVWVNDFVNSNNATVTISPDRSNTSSTVSDRAYEFYTTTPDRTPRPLTGAPVNWKTEEIPSS